MGSYKLSGQKFGQRERPYEPYVGRWSRRVAQEFLNWLAVPPGSRWLDAEQGL